MVTNYLGGNPPPTLEGLPGGGHHHHHHHPLPAPQHRHLQHQHHIQSQHQHHHIQSQQHQQYGVQPMHTHGPPRRLMRMAEIPTMDSMTAEALGGGPTPETFIPPIPTISITPHSPINHKPFAVLGESFFILS